MILVDSNVPMYLVGAPHAHKSDTQRLLEQSVSDGQRKVTDAEGNHHQKFLTACVAVLFLRCKVSYP